MVVAIRRFSVRRDGIAQRAEDAQSPATRLIQDTIADTPVESVAVHDDVVVVLKYAATVNVDRDCGRARTAAVDASEESRDKHIADEDLVGARNINAHIHTAVETTDRNVADGDVGRLVVEADGRHAVGQSGEYQVARSVNACAGEREPRRENQGLGERYAAINDQRRARELRAFQGFQEARQL